MCILLHRNQSGSNITLSELHESLLAAEVQMTPQALGGAF
jgi:hypothetical protein